MKQVEAITVAELQEMANNMYGEAYLLEQSSRQQDLWGINLHPADYGTEDFIEFDSMINIRPGQGNASKDVLDLAVRKQIMGVVEAVVRG